MMHRCTEQTDAQKTLLVEIQMIKIPLLFLFQEWRFSKQLGFGLNYTSFHNSTHSAVVICST